MITFMFSDNAELMDFVTSVSEFLFDKYSSVEGEYGILISRNSVTIYDVNEVCEDLLSDYQPKHAKNARILNE